MKYFLLVLSSCSFLSSLFAESNLPRKLAEAYQVNNELIYEKVPLGANESIGLLTTNYIEQLKHIKQLSDEKLKRELNWQNLRFISDKTLLQKHILNLYECPVKDWQTCNPSIYRQTLAKKIKPGVNGQDAVMLIHKIKSIFNAMNQDPECARELYGIMPKGTVNQWYFEALENKRKMFPCRREIRNIQVREMEKSARGDVQIYYIFGQLVGEKAQQLVMMRMVIERGSFGLFVKEMAQTMNPILVQRMERALLQKIECSH